MCPRSTTLWIPWINLYILIWQSVIISADSQLISSSLNTKAPSIQVLCCRTAGSWWAVVYSIEQKWEEIWMDKCWSGWRWFWNLCFRFISLRIDANQHRRIYKCSGTSERSLASCTSQLQCLTSLQIVLFLRNPKHWSHRWLIQHLWHSYAWYQSRLIASAWRENFEPLAFLWTQRTDQHRDTFKQVLKELKNWPENTSFYSKAFC